MTDIPDLPRRKNFGKITVAEGTGPAHSNLATGLKRATLKSSSVLHPLKPYRKSIIKAFNNPVTKLKIRRGGLSNIDQIKLYRKILALDDKAPKSENFGFRRTPKKDKDYIELKNAKFARDVLKYKLLKHFAKQPKIAARVREQFSENLPLGKKAVSSIDKYRGTGETMAKASRVVYSSVHDRVQGKSLDPSKLNRLAKNNKLKPLNNKFALPLNRRLASANDLPKSSPPVNLVN